MSVNVEWWVYSFQKEESGREQRTFMACKEVVEEVFAEQDFASDGGWIQGVMASAPYALRQTR